jgi:hypothetical protein
MKEISYTAHLELRLKLRGIPHDLPKKIYFTATERYFDKETQKIVAVKSALHKSKKRELAVIYQEDENMVRLITIHPLKEYQKISRIKLGRWQKL